MAHTIRFWQKWNDKTVLYFEAIGAMRGLTAGYVIRRLGLFVLTIWLGATIIFIIPRLMPGDPVEAVVGRMIERAGRVENSAVMIEAWRKKFGLDRPAF